MDGSVYSINAGMEYMEWFMMFHNGEYSQVIRNKQF